MSVYRAGYVAIVGMPNSGKSTLINKIMNQKLSIVSPRPQTTRKRVEAIISDEESQMVLVDAPGFVRADKGLNGFLNKECEDIVLGSDVIVAIVPLDEKRPENVDRVLDAVIATGKPWIGVINKSDISEFSRRIPIIRLKMDLAKVPVLIRSHNESVDELLDLIREKLPAEQAPLFDESLFTPHPVRDFASEFIREACFECLHDEVPYGVAIEIVQFDESKKVPRIHANVIVAKDSHKAIVVGKKGQTVKQIGSRARKSIEGLMDQQIYLELNVTVKPDWMNNKNFMKEQGYVVSR